MHDMRQLASIIEVKSHSTTRLDHRDYIRILIDLWIRLNIDAEMMTVQAQRRQVPEARSPQGIKN
jgi:hypothetical protein